jgi:hypothetical protein
LAKRLADAAADPVVGDADFLLHRRAGRLFTSGKQQGDPGDNRNGGNGYPKKFHRKRTGNLLLCPQAASPLLCRLAKPVFRLAGGRVKNSLCLLRPELECRFPSNQIQMKTKHRIINLLALASFLVANAAQAEWTFETNFDDDIPDGSEVYGATVVEWIDDDGEDGVLQLTLAEASQNGSWIVDDFSDGQTVGEFEATFRMLMGGNT